MCINRALLMNSEGLMTVGRVERLASGSRRGLICLCMLLMTAALWVFDASAEGRNHGGTPAYRPRIVASYPHDRQAFTQGLVYADGFLYEGTGLTGASSLRKVDLRTGRVLKEIRLDPSHFGEGIALFRDRIVQLTWQSRMGFVYDKATFRLLRTFGYPWEGWGITHDGRRFILSDGTSVLHFLDPENFREISSIAISDEKGPVLGLNELEYVRGFIYANVWPTDRIAIIHPRTGRVEAWLDLSGLLGQAEAQGVDVLNGIAYDAKGKRLFVTGKYWPRVFEIRSEFAPAKPGRREGRSSGAAR